MPRPCPNCGEENPDRARFCLSCGRELAAGDEPRREVRKTVTIVFSDLAGSTAIGERLDPEALRSVMDRYFARMREVIESHGGIVEKFIGDAVMAVFGIPTLHEDDAVRAVRAAVGMLEALGDLNRDLEPARGVRLEARVGIQTGEVVTGDPAEGQRLVTGDPVNVAARLEQAAGSGEILLGEATMRLVRDDVDAEAVPPLDLKGKSQPVAAYRLRSVSKRSGRDMSAVRSPLVGRERERSLLAESFTRTVTDRTCQLFTVLGPAGVGKSRLTAEFLGAIRDRANVLRGRCLPYGDGITYWPLREIVAAAADIDDDAPPGQALDRVRGIAGGSNEIADQVAALIGLHDRPVEAEAGARATRLLFQRLGADRPLVILFDDIHWAEPAMLDLIEHVADWAHDVPIMLTCTARPELLEQRPGWGGGKVNATSILLQPLSPDESRVLISNLLGGTGLDAETAGRIVEAAEGNPLFVEQMVAALVDEGVLALHDGGWTVVGDVSSIPVPGSIQALLAARLDRLARDERAVIERASVVGRVFYRSAVAELAPDAIRTDVGAHLRSLVRKELIRPDAAEFDEDTFRFIHMLVRDSAYDAMPKQLRAELHERFARWLEAAAGAREREFDEIVAYHYEEAYRNRTELGSTDDHTRELGRIASARLAAAAKRAATRGDVGATANLYGRAIAAAPEDSVPVEWLIDYGIRLTETERIDKATDVFRRAARRAEAAGDPSLAVWAETLVGVVAGAMDPSTSIADVLADITRAIPLLEAAGHRDRVADAAIQAGLHEFWLGRAGRAAGWWERALAEAEAIQHAPAAAEARRALCLAYQYGPTPVSEAIPRMEELLAATRGRGAEPAALCSLGVLVASSGRIDEGRQLVDRGLALAADFGQDTLPAGQHPRGLVEAMAGEWATIVERLTPGLRRLEATGHLSFAATTAGFIAEAQERLGNLAEAEEAAERALEMAPADDVIAQSQARRVLALVRARRGQVAEADRLSEEVAALASRIDYSYELFSASLSAAGVAAIAGRQDDALAAARRALEHAERRENVPLTERASALIRDLEAGTWRPGP